MKRAGLHSHRLNSLVFVTTIFAMCVWFFISRQAESVDLTENRELAAMPELSRDTAFNGVFANGVEAFVADHFPLRQPLLAVNFAIRQNLGFRLGDVKIYTDEQDDDSPVDVDQAGTNAAAAPDTSLVMLASAGSPGSTGEPGGPHMPGKTSPPVAANNDGPDRSAEVTVKRRVIISDGRAMRAFTGTPEGSRGWANVLNTYRREIPADVRVYAMMVPTASEFYWPEASPIKSMSEKAFIDSAYKALDSGITMVDSWSELKAHAAEHIYFRTDHHWTGLGAYHAYRALCRAAGLNPAPLESMQKKTKKGWLGSHHTVTHDRTLRENRDPVDYWIPAVDTEVFKSFDISQRGTRIKLLAEEERGYGVFLGADYSLVTIRSSIRNGRRAIVVRNSFGNPLGVFMAASFEETYLVDYRYYKGSLLKIISEKKITDVIILSGAPSANSADHYGRILRLLKGLPQPKTPTSPLASHQEPPQCIIKRT